MKLIHATPAALVAALAAAPAVAQSWSFVALPDTQVYSDRPELNYIFEAQTQWVVDNAAAVGIEFVTHLGDIVQNGANGREWDAAELAMDKLFAAGIPHGLAMGNHDNQYNDSESSYTDLAVNPLADVRYPIAFANQEDLDPTGLDFRERFGPQMFAGECWYAGASPSELSNFQLITGPDGSEFVFMHIAVDTPQQELDWAQGVLYAFPDRAVVLTTHRYIYDYRAFAGRQDDLVHDLIDPLYYNTAAHGYDSVRSQDLWENFISVNRNIFLTLNGHVDGEFRQTDPNVFGLDVHQLMQDYQSSTPRGGDGFLRIFEVDAANDRVIVDTYTPLDANGLVDGTGRFRTLQDQREDALRLFDFGGVDELFDAAAGLDPSIQAIILSIVSQPDAIITIFDTIAAAEDPATEIANLAILFGLDPADVAEFEALINAFDFDSVNRPLVQAINDNAVPIFTEVLEGDRAGLIALLEADDYAIVDAALFSDGSRDSAFELPFVYASYVTAFDAASVTGFVSLLEGGDIPAQTLAAPFDTGDFTDVAAFLNYRVAGCN